MTKYYTDGYMIGGNPSKIGGGYTIVDENNNLIERKEIIQVNFTNNEAEILGILNAMKLAEYEDTVSTDSKCCLLWTNKGMSKSRPDLFPLIQECKTLLKEKNINLIWEGRDFNLAGIYNEKKGHSRGHKKYIGKLVRIYGYNKQRPTR